MYEISPRTYKIAKDLGLTVFPSGNKKYKIEVYDKDGLFMYYGGDARYNDYHIYLRDFGKSYAKERQRLYMIRHRPEIESVGSRGWVIYKLLWF
jgi:hypothetical protein